MIFGFMKSILTHYLLDGNLFQLFFLAYKDFNKEYLILV